MKPLVIYNRLYKYFGPQHWWPISSKRGDKRFEICVGAILTQNTNWQNVEKALTNLRKEKMLTACVIAKCQTSKLERLIKPSGYYRQKAKKLKIFSKYICDNYKADTKKFLQGNLLNKREELLSIWGIGPETVDSILLYAGGKPIFVIDAYTKRLCAECGVTFKNYEEYQKYFEKHVPKSVKKYNEFHALIVKWGKEHSKNKKKTLISRA